MNSTHLFNNSSYSDIKVVIRADGIAGIEHIHAHKLVLSQGSPTLKQLIDKDGVEVISLTKYTRTAAMVCLRYIYMNTVTPAGVGHFISIIECAEFLGLADLVKALHISHPREHCGVSLVYFIKHDMSDSVACAQEFTYLCHDIPSAIDSLAANCDHDLMLLVFTALVKFDVIAALACVCSWVGEHPSDIGVLYLCMGQVRNLSLAELTTVCSLPYICDMPLARMFKTTTHPHVHKWIQSRC